MVKPIIAINFKNYEHSTGDNALILAKICESVSENIIICVNAIDLQNVAENTKCSVFAQHVDGLDYGGYTGKILPKMVKSAGGLGSILNHSEDRYDFEDLKQAIKKCKQNNLFTLVCAKDDFEAQEIAKLEPDAIAVEPPELIGGDISVTKADPQVITKTVNMVKQINDNILVLCGAGVKSGEDVRKAIELGAGGVLLASGVTKADNVKEVLVDLYSGLLN